jgi:GT2 family glycosyltransferase
MDPPDRPHISAVILARNRADALRTVLTRLDALPVDEVIVVDNGSEDATPALVDGWGGKVRRIANGRNIGVAGRNVGARAARSDVLLMLDDDSYPLAGAIEALAAALARSPRLAVAGGLVTDVDAEGRRLRETELGTFDWFLRAGRQGAEPDGGFPAIFFPEGACLVRRDAYLEVGGCFEPYFFGVAEVDLTTRLLGAGWEVGYFPGAPFEHMKVQAGRTPPRDAMRLYVRNQLWYFWRHFPAGLAARRIPAYLLFDLVLCVAYGVAGSWWAGIGDAWRQRGRVRGTRRALPRDVIRRAERNRGRLHIRLLALQLLRRARRA